MLVIHAGTPKTGTKTLQEHLLRNSDVLLERGIRYIRAGREKGRGTSHNDLARTVRGKGDIAVWDRVRDELAQSDSRINVISAEGLWLGDPAELKRLLGDVPDVQIVVYLRRQDRYLQSLYMQAVASGRSHSFAAWRKSVPDRGKYLDSVDNWAAAFGDKSIVIRPYERAGVVDTTADFTRLIGADGLTSDPDLRRNASPRLELLQFIRALNNLDLSLDEHKLFKTLIGRDPAYACSSDLLTYEESLALLQSYAEENRILTEKYYRDGSDPLFPELVPFDGPERWNLNGEQYHKLMVDVLDVLIAFAADGRISRGETRGRGRRRRPLRSDEERP